MNRSRLLVLMFKLHLIRGLITSTEINEEFNSLNMHHDHCTKPMKFSLVTFKCECPAPFQRQENKCTCPQCIFELMEHKYSEGVGTNLPTYINEVLEELDEDSVPDDDDNLESRIDLGKTGSSHQKRSVNPPGFPTFHDPDLDARFYGQVLINYPAMLRVQRRPKIRKIWGPCKENEFNSIRFRSFLPQKRKKPTRFVIDLRRAAYSKEILKRKSSPIEQPKMKVKHKPIKSLKGQSFSDSVIGGSLSGKAHAGYEKSEGSVNSYLGTGVLVLGSGGGSAGSAAFTGYGNSKLTANTAGSSAEGEGFIGGTANDASSTASLLLGKGDTIAINSLGSKGSSSSASIATDRVAGAATSAYGPASAAASAAPGKGSVSSSANFGQNITSSANVDNKNGNLVESAAVGDPNQDIRLIQDRSDKNVESQTFPIHLEPTDFDFDALFRSMPENMIF